MDVRKKTKRRGKREREETFLQMFALTHRSSIRPESVIAGRWVIKKEKINTHRINILRSSSWS